MKFQYTLTICLSLFPLILKGNIDEENFDQIETGLPTTDKIIEDGLALTDKITELGIV